jgi:hypothetical protein
MQRARGLRADTNLDVTADDRHAHELSVASLSGDGKDRAHIVDLDCAGADYEALGGIVGDLKAGGAASDGDSLLEGLSRRDRDARKGLELDVRFGEFERARFPR